MELKYFVAFDIVCNVFHPTEIYLEARKLNYIITFDIVCKVTTLLKYFQRSES